ncbi:ATP-binding protein [Psychroserpens sp. XS_ASV72]|uniref:sensor histidine kinase n=1 Tax=Psychroserpens sp. XS_ASV72 TaxID=3241293 RepID=UPI003510EABF
MGKQKDKDEKFHFDITPHIVKQLGEELVPDEVTALMELIKNSYDADASYVSIEINSFGNLKDDNLFFKGKEGYILVEDDGIGMDLEIISNSWLVISSSSKRSFKKDGNKTKKNRTPLGDKGLGRLSTQRLADVCEFFTKMEKKEGIHVGFNWKEFETNLKLSEVKVHKELAELTNKGTKIVLTGLRDKNVWGGVNLEKFKAQIVQLISPYKEDNKHPFDVYLKVNNDVIDLEESQLALQDLAISSYSFDFSENTLTIQGKTKLEKFLGQNLKRDDYHEFLLPDNGKKFSEYVLAKKGREYIDASKDKKYLFTFKKTFDISEIPDLQFVDGKKANPGKFKGRIDDFLLDNWLDGEESIKDVFNNIKNYKSFALNQLGIKIYRNGFAVFPYGFEKSLDWMKLGDDKTHGKSFYSLRPGNVIGYFLIDEGENKNLKDKTDRQGFISNPYSDNFIQLAYFIRDNINSYLNDVRRDYNTFLREFKTQTSSIKTQSDAIKTGKELAIQAKENKVESEKALDSLTKSKKELSKIHKEHSSTSILSTPETARIAQSLESILIDIEEAESALKKSNSIISKAERIKDVINILEPKIEILEEQLENFSELASLGLTAEAVSHEFATIADRLGERSIFYSQKLKNNKLTESDIFVLIEYINSTVNGLKIQLKHLDPSLKYNKEKREIIDLRSYFRDEEEYYKSRFEKNGIDFIVNIEDNFSIKMNKGKLTQIIDNLINNSEYWLKEKQKESSSFKPSITMSVSKPWMSIKDNGDGVSKSIENQLFEPFATMKPKNKGRGLGLFITQQLLDASGCTIALEPKRNKYGKKFIFTINLNNVIEQE